MLANFFLFGILIVWTLTAFGSYHYPKKQIIMQGAFFAPYFDCD